MKRNFLKLAAGEKLSKKEFREMLMSAMRANYDSRIMYRYLREHAPDLTEPEKVALDRDCVWMLAERNGIEVYEVPKNKGVLSCLVFDRKENHQAYNTLDYTRQLLRGIGKGKKSTKADKGEKKNSRSTPKAEAARIAKAHHDAGYLMSLAQALMAEANRIVAAK
jgi:hypothetical protein